MQSLIQQYAGKVAGERTTRTIRAVHTGRKSNDEQARRRSAKRRNRASMVIGMRNADLIQKTGETWASTTVEIKKHENGNKKRLVTRR